MHHPDPAPSRVFFRRLLIVGLAGVILRFAAGAIVNVDAADGSIRGYQFYLEMARNYLAGNGMHWRFYLGMGEKWANRPPAYPLLLAAALKSGWWPYSAIALQALVGGLVAVVAGALARILSGPAAGIAAALLVAVYPYYVILDTTILEHGLLTLGVALTALSFAVAVRRGSGPFAALTGLAAAGSTLVRVSFASALPLLCLAFLPAAGLRRGLRLGAIAAVFAGAALLPWVVRNARVVGHPVLSSDMGRALWVGNNDWTYRIYPHESIDLAEKAAYRRLPDEAKARVRAARNDEIAQSLVFREIALRRIRSHPGEFLRGAAEKLWAFLSPRLNPPTEPPAWKNLVYSLTYGPALLLAVAGFWLLRRRWREWLSVPAMLLAFAATAAVFWGESRHRAPLDALFLVGAAVALVRVWPRPFAWLAGESRAGGDDEGGPGAAEIA